MKKFLFLITIILLPLVAYSHDWLWDFSKDGIRYRVYDDMTVEVISYRTLYTGHIYIPERVNYLSKDYDVTSIGNEAFSGCTGLTSVWIPFSVTNIGKKAFSGCSGLKSIQIPNNVTNIGDSAFYECSGFTSIKIPPKVTNIGNHAFYGCSGLTSIEIPNSVTSLGKYAFYGSNLSVTFHCSMIDSWVSLADIREIIIGEEVRQIEGSPSLDFSWRNLTSIKVIVTDPSSFLTLKKSHLMEGLDYNLYQFDQKVTLIDVDGIEIRDFVIPSNQKKIWDHAFARCGGLTSIEIPNSVMEIGDYAFSGCSGLTSVTIPNSVTNIGFGAFYKCSGLTSIDIPNSAMSIGCEAFYGCSGLTSVTIGNSVTHIGDNAFSGCSGLTSLTLHNLREGVLGILKWWFEEKNSIKELNIGDGVETIIDKAFSGMEGITSVTIGNSVTSIGNYAFKGCSSLTSLTIPNSVTSIGNGAFRGCSGLTSVTIGNSVTNIGDKAFYECSGLTSIEIPNSVMNIGSYAFSRCSGLTSVTIGNSVTNIESNTFSRCSGLTSIEIPNSVMKIDTAAFKGCSGLTSLTIPNSVTNIGDSAFYKCSGLTSIEIPNSVTSIGEYAFYECSGLTSIEIPNSVIGEYAFSSCTSLASVTIGKSVTSIGEYAFSSCTSLASVTIGKSVKSIGEYAFSSCTSLTSVTVYMKEPVAIKGNTFPYIRRYATLYVPSGKVFEYQNASYWKDFKEILTFSSPAIVFADPIVKKICVDNWDLDHDGELSEYEAAEVTSINKKFNNTWITSFDELQYFTGLTSFYYDFMFDTKMTSIIIPNSVTDIGEMAFYECNRLTSVTIPNSVTSIGKQAFIRSGLTSVTIPKLVNTIGSSAFFECTNLTTVIVENPTPVIITSMTFSNRENAILFVPVGSKSAYQSADYWKEFKEIYEGTPDLITITANNYTVEYGAEMPTFGYTCEGSTIGGEPSFSCEATSTSPVGTYPITISEGSVSNYNVKYVNGTLTITKAPLFISVGYYTRKKGKENPEFVLRYQDFKNGETEDVLTKKPTVTTEATKSSPVGVYPIVISGAEAQNYKISYINGSIKVELLPGDANSDGELTETDRNYIVRHIMGDTPDDFDEEAANLNGDEKIDVADIVELNNQLAPKD